METKNADLSSLRIDRSNKEDINSGKKNIFISLGIIVLIIVGYFIISSFLGSSVEVKLTTAILQKPGQSSASLNSKRLCCSTKKSGYCV